MATKKRTRKTKPNAQGQYQVGRPLLTIDDLPPNWKDTMVDLAQKGQSAVSARCALGIGKDTWYRFINDYPEFSTIANQCHELCQHWWESQGQKMAKNGVGSASVWRFNMQNRFDWRDKVDNSIGGNGKPIRHGETKELTDAELQAELEARGLPSNIFEE